MIYMFGGRQCGKTKMMEERMKILLGWQDTFYSLESDFLFPMMSTSELSIFEMSDQMRRLKACQDAFYTFKDIQYTIPVIEPIALDKFERACICITEDQKNAIWEMGSRMGIAYKELSDALVQIMKPVGKSLQELCNILIPIVQEKEYYKKLDYSEKSKPWEKKRFYY